MARSAPSRSSRDDAAPEAGDFRRKIDPNAFLIEEHLQTVADPLLQIVRQG